jgi:tetratricopeptide (TPR) repeat protein
MGKLSLKLANPTVKSLLVKQQYSEAITLLEKVCHTLGGSEEWIEFLGLLEEMPETYLLESVDAAELYAKALKWLKKNEALLVWASRVVKKHGVEKAASVQSEWASGLIVAQQYNEARLLLSEALPHLSNEALGTAWARLGYTLFYINEPVGVWRQAFASAYSLLQGGELGRALLNEGYCLAKSGQHAECQGVWLEALGYFHGNPYFQTWVRYQLGTSNLRNLEPEAERHFLEAVNLTKNPKAAELRVAVLNGLAASRRVLGEWDRAESSYHEALRLEGDSHDRNTSYLGLARTQRLSGRPSQALETIELALQDESIEPPMLYVARSMAYLSLSQPTQAASALASAGEIEADSDRWLWRIAKAELCRQQGQAEEAVALLEGLPLHTLHAREEVRQWPKLFELVQQAGRQIPLPLEYPSQTTVEVKALGLLEVFINGRPLALAPLNLTGELLVFLLEHGGQASSEQIVAALWPDCTAAEKRKTLNGLARDLRRVLGWPASLRALRGAFGLDPGTLWVYDVAQARAEKRVHKTFLDGNYKEWALEVNEELEAFREQR